VPAIHHAIDVAATPEACWRVFADLSTWPEWFPLCKHAPHADGDWRIGGKLELQFDVGMPVSVTVTVEELEPGKRVRWVGGRLGVAGNHWYSFSVNSPGLTRVTSHEEFTGMATRFLPRVVVDRIDDEVHRSMARFKALVEGRT
jgi:hypothetical protein